MIYQNLHISYADIMQKNQDHSVEAATRIRPKTAIFSKWSRDAKKIRTFRPKLRFFELLTPLRHFLVYQHDISKFAYKLCGYYAKKSGPSVEAATRIRPKTAIKWSRDQAKITVFRAFDPITSLFGIPT